MTRAAAAQKRPLKLWIIRHNLGTRPWKLARSREGALHVCVSCPRTLTTDFFNRSSPLICTRITDQDSQAVSFLKDTMAELSFATRKKLKKKPGSNVNLLDNLKDSRDPSTPRTSHTLITKKSFTSIVAKLGSTDNAVWRLYLDSADLEKLSAAWTSDCRDTLTPEPICTKNTRLKKGSRQQKRP